MPPPRPFTASECAALAQAGIIHAGEQDDVLAGRRPFTVDEYLAMAGGRHPARGRPR